jgi:hypothetical protein
VPGALVVFGDHSAGGELHRLKRGGNARVGIR